MLVIGEEAKFIAEVAAICAQLGVELRKSCEGDSNPSGKGIVRASARVLLKSVLDGGRGHF